MVLGPFAETKEPRLPGRNPATQSITLKRGTRYRSVVKSFVRRLEKQSADKGFKKQVGQVETELPQQQICSHTLPL
ncbi:MAG TPA: hypothetical protein DD706_01475 [Nitrospiraceae bacterium]|nr:hypothetical protein [Nitrospiraceae bacterium]